MVRAGGGGLGGTCAGVPNIETSGCAAGGPPSSIAIASARVPDQDHGCVVPHELCKSKAFLGVGSYCNHQRRTAQPRSPWLPPGTVPLPERET